MNECVTTDAGGPYLEANALVGRTFKCVYNRIATVASIWVLYRDGFTEHRKSTLTAELHTTPAGPSTNRPCLRMTLLHIPCCSDPAVHDDSSNQFQSQEMPRLNDKMNNSSAQGTLAKPIMPTSSWGRAVAYCGPRRGPTGCWSDGWPQLSIQTPGLSARTP